MGEKSNFARYISGEVNAVRDEFMLSRERARTGELIHVTHTESQSSVYEFWNSPSKGQGTEKPKHTGGKKPYVMLMVERLVMLLANGLPAEQIGYLVCLSPYVDWGTGKLVIGRTKRRMKFTDMMKTFQRNYKETQVIVAALKVHDLLVYKHSQGYFVSRDLIKRGGKRDEAKISERDNARKDC